MAEVDVSNLWQKFGLPSTPSSLGIPRVACDAGSSVAGAAVAAAGLHISGREQGGDLGSLDIKRMDVKTAISMSLMHQYVSTGSLYELVADTSGGVEFIEVDSGGGGLGTVYYSTQTTSFSNPVTDVLVTGGKPLPDINFRGWYNVLKDSETFTQKDMLENCRKADFKRYATIVYKDPHLDSTYKDGVTNLYEITSPWEKIVGYAHYKDPGKDLQTRPDITINWSQESRIPYKITNGVNNSNKAGGSSTASASTGTTAINLNTCPEVKMGKLQERQNYDKMDTEAACYSTAGTFVPPTDGVEVIIPEKWRYDTVRGVQQDNLIRIAGVYLIGLPIDLLFYAPLEATKVIETPNVGNSIIWASMNRLTLTTFKCEEGKHYAIGVADKKNYIVFARETRNGDPFPYGASTKFRLDPTCNIARKMTTAAVGEFTGTIFPTTKTTGMLVYDIWVEVDISTPCINIFDPEGKAATLAEKFKYHICPVTAIEPPAPIANSAGIIDQEPSISDTDPTTSQNFSTTPMENALDKMSGGGLSVSWSFLESESAVSSAASKLYALMRDTTVETVYTCGPDASPQLGGGAVGGGVINAIRYSYTDQSSYTISVTAGPKLPPSSIVSVDGGPMPMMVENVSARGTVVASAGDNVNFKVRIDGYGERWAVCMCASIIRVGDIVQCSIHNNPVEY